jgi:holo-[acyl-carrier protein] synthase
LILGTGIDICDAARLQEWLASPDPGLMASVFTPTEVAYCSGKRSPALHLAARFAAKEAVVKALSASPATGSFWLDIEIVNAPGGQPEVRLRGRAADVAAGLGVSRVWVSLTHVESTAVASVILEGGGDNASLP